MFIRPARARESPYDAEDDGRSSSQTPPPARPGPSRTRRYATQRAQGKRPQETSYSFEDDYLTDRDNVIFPIQAVNTHQLLEKLLTNAALGITRGDIGSRNLHSSLLLIRTRLDSETARAAEADSRASALLQRVQDALTDATNARAELAATRESLRAHEVQLAQAQAEIHCAQRTVDALERARDDAERDAAEARTKARQAKLDHAVVVAREEGRRIGVEEGFRRGRTVGLHEGRQNARIALQEQEASDYDTAEEDALPSAVSGPSSSVTRISMRPYSVGSTQNRPRRASEPGTAPQPPKPAPIPTASAFLLRPLRKPTHADQPPSPAPIVVPATPTSPLPMPGRSKDHPPRPASAPIRPIIRQPSPQLPTRTAGTQTSSGSIDGSSLANETPMPVDSSQGATTASLSATESSVGYGPAPHYPNSGDREYLSSQQVPQTSYHNTLGRMLETPNSLPPTTPIEPTAAPAIYSPFPLPSISSHQPQYSVRSHSPREQAPRASPSYQPPVRPRAKEIVAPTHDPSFSPWSFVHSPVVPEAMRAPIIVNSMHISPISVPISEIDLVTHAPPPDDTAPAGQSQLVQPALRRLGTLRDLLGETGTDAGNRRGTPIEDGRRSAHGKRSPLGPRPRHGTDSDVTSRALSPPQDLDSRTRSPFDWFLRRSVRPSVRRAETSGTIPIEVHSPTETMTVPSQNRSPPGAHSLSSPGFLSPEPQEYTSLWPPDPEPLRAATVSAVSESPSLAEKQLESDENMRWAQGQQFSLQAGMSASALSDSPREISPLDVGEGSGPLGFVPIRTGADYFASTLVKYPILRDSMRSPVQHSESDSQTGTQSSKRKRRSQSPSVSRTRYAEAPIPAGLIYPESPIRRTDLRTHHG